MTVYKNGNETEIYCALDSGNVIKYGQVDNYMKHSMDTPNWERMVKNNVLREKLNASGNNVEEDDDVDDDDDDDDNEDEEF